MTCISVCATKQGRRKSQIPMLSLAFSTGIICKSMSCPSCTSTEHASYLLSGNQGTMEMESRTLTAQQICIRNAVCSVLDIAVSALDPSATFTSLGGDSLSAIAVSNQCRRSNIFLPVPAILKESPISKLNRHGVYQQRPQKRRLPFESRAFQRITRPCLEQRSPTGICHTPLLSMTEKKRNTCDLTNMQLALVHGSRIRPGSNVISFVETYRTGDLEAIKRGWQAAIKAEPIFHLCGTLEELSHGSALFGSQEPQWVEVTVSSEDQYRAEVASPPPTSDLKTSFKVVTLLKPNPSEHLSTIVWRVHHVLIDGWSARLVYLNARRVAEGLGLQKHLSFHGIPGRLTELADASTDELKRFWASRRIEEHRGDIVLEGAEESPVLCSSTQPTSVSAVDCSVDCDRVTLWCREHSVTPAALFSAAWALVLCMYTDFNAVVFGVAVSGRSLPVDEIESAIGPLVNVLPLCVRVPWSARSPDFIRLVLDNIASLEAVAHSNPTHGFQRTFCSALSQDMDFKGPNDARIRPVGPSSFDITSDIPLAITIRPNGGLRLTYHCNRYSAQQMQHLAGHYSNAIHALLNSNCSMKSCMEDIVVGQSREELLGFGNCYSARTFASSIEEDLVTLFEASVRESPDGVALEKGENRLTYRQLDNRATIVAGKLRDLIRPGESVCVHADRSLNWIIAVYGILKAGGVYAPLHPDLPSEARRQNIQTVACKVLLTPAASDSAACSGICENVLSVESILEHVSDSADTCGFSHRPSSNPASNAYICFTSGSSGKPKAVLCTHEGLVAFQKDEQVRLHARPGIRISQTMSPAFDGSIHELFSALSYGATLVLQPRAQPLDQLWKADSAILIPSVAAVLDPDDYPQLRYVYFVGEAVPEPVKVAWSASKQLYNMYGPTEATCGSTIKRLLPSEPVTIGGPNPSTRLYILDREKRLLPRGVVGEIYAAGIQVARRYVGNETLTADRFLPDSVCKRGAEQMYRTGDHGYWTASGEIAFLGRNDRQVKLHGHRLDLEDLEARITAAVPAAKSAAMVMVRSGGEDGDNWLGAMLQPGTALSLEEAWKGIRCTLPAYACPRRVLIRDSMPLTAVGKLDHKAVAAKFAAAARDEEDAVPLHAQTPTETVLERVWREVLQLPPSQPIDRHASFACMGGGSLEHLAMCDALSAALHATVPLRLIWTARDFGSLAAALDEHVCTSPPPPALACASPTLGMHSVSPIEAEWLAHYARADGAPGSAAFNVAMIWQIDSSVDRAQLAAAWNKVLQRHRILSSRFVTETYRARRVYGPHPRALVLDSDEGLDARSFVDEPFRLSAAEPLARVCIAPSTLAISISHVLADLTTLRVVLAEVGAVYAGRELPALQQTYEHTTWDAQAPSPSLQFWPAYLERALTARRQAPPSPRPSFSGTSRARRLPAGVAARARSFVSSSAFTLHQLALGAVALAAQRGGIGGATVDGPLVLGAPFLNRSPLHRRTVGLFLEPLPVAVHPRSGAHGRGFLADVQASSQAALEHAIPWHRLRELLAERPADAAPEEGGLQGTPPFDVMVTVHENAWTDSDGLGIGGCRPTVCWANGAKFPLMCEFSTVGSDGLMLRVEWDDGLFLPARIDAFFNDVCTALDACVSGSESLGEAMQMAQGDNGEGEEVAWGTLLSELQ